MVSGLVKKKNYLYKYFKFKMPQYNHHYFFFFPGIKILKKPDRKNVKENGY